MSTVTDEPDELLDQVLEDERADRLQQVRDLDTEGVDQSKQFCASCSTAR
jgi:hypothetical protein